MWAEQGEVSAQQSVSSNFTWKAAHYQTHSSSSFLPLWSVFTQSSRICRCPLCVCMQSHFSRVQLFETPWTPLSMGFCRQEHWSRLPCPPPGDLPDPGMEIASLMSNLHWQAGSLPLMPPGKPTGSLYGSFVSVLWHCALDLLHVFTWTNPGHH